jgi:hypothetical protein
MANVNEEKPDWSDLVRERLERRPLHLPPHAQEEVIAELAAHLEEVSQNARANGLTDSAATALALQEVQNWRVLSAQISRARSKEEIMNHRTKTLWLPALATFLGTSLSLMLCQFSGLRPRILWVGGYSIWFYWPWLLTLPLLGAAGAHLSLRAHGHVATRIAASLSPALIMLTVLLLILPWGFIIDGFHFFQLVGFGILLISWVALPALALLLGAAPFLREPKLAEVY